MRTLILTLFLLLGQSTIAAADCVILLHGLARSANSFLIMEKALEAVGYDVVNEDYPSKSGSIEKLALSTIPRTLSKCPEPEMSETHFVTHSMGGILLRYFLKQKPDFISNFGRAVMLAPPNKGSEIVTKLGDLSAFEWLAGETGKQLGTGSDSFPNSIGPTSHDIGIIAGNRSISALSAMIPGEDDGKVSVASTRLEGARDHMVLPVTHTFLMNDLDVIMQVAHYLREGKFKRSKN